MSRGLDKTLKYLTDTANEAAVPVLISALDSTDRVVQEGALRALMSRRRGAGQRELVRRWNRLNKRWKLTIAQQPRQVATAVRSALLSTDSELCANGCDALLHIREYELIPALVTAAAESNNPQARMVAQTLLNLAELLYEEISGPRENQRRQDPLRVRQQVLPSLQEAVDRFEQHHHREILEAFLLLTTHENAVLRRILGDPHHPAYLIMVEILGNSTRLGIIRLVLNFIEHRHAPSIALQILSHRRDLTFIRQALRRIGDAPTRQIRSNLRRVESIAWLRDDLDLLDALTEKEQEATVALATHSGMNRLEAFEVLKYLLKQGETASRRAASASFSTFGGAEANQLALEGLKDPDPVVQANMVVQLRERGIPGAISRLINLLDSEHEVVATAAQRCLVEFNFDRYLSVFDVMEVGTRRSTGQLVMRVDENAVPQLVKELKARTRTRRLRGLEAAVAMNAVAAVEPLVIGMLADKDHFLRAEAARTLGDCHTPLAQQALREALSDRSVAVREAAEQALLKSAQSAETPSFGSLASALQVAEHNPLMDAPPTEAPSG